AGRAGPAGPAGPDRRVYCAVQPPSTKSRLPVTKDEASEARKTTAPAISVSSPHRPIGIFATNAAYFSGSFISGRFISVPNGPGQIALTVTPCVAHSSASTRVRFAIAAFEAP